MMATKQCPGCRKQAPVACKKCGCGHVFFAARRPSTKGRKDEVQGKKEKEKVTKTSPSASKAHPPPSVYPDLNEQDDNVALSSLRQLKQEEPNLPIRRTGRIQREKPNFYDALEYDTHRRKQRVVKTKARNEESPVASVSEPPQKEIKLEQPAPVTKKRRGRPPRLTTKSVKTVKPTVSLPVLNNKVKPSKGLPQTISVPGDFFQEDLMKGITPEKALQCTTILDDINRKWVTISWRI